MEPKAIGGLFSLPDKHALWRIPIVLLVIVVLPGCCAWVYVAQPTTRGAKTMDVQVDTDALKAHVCFLSEDCFPRHSNNIANLDRAADRIREAFAQAGAEPRDQTFELEGNTYRNVIGRLGPAGGPVVVVGAHYDSCGLTPGADDNASAVAGLLELARLLGKDSDKLTRPVELVAYTLEEPPYFATANMGSARHAKALGEAGTDVAAVIVLEMIGYFTDERRTQRFPMRALHLCYPSRGNFIGVVGRFADRKLTKRVKVLMKGVTPLKVCSLNAPAKLPGVDFSDHRNYWSEGYSAVMITDTAFYRNPNYHELTDTWDTLDYTRMACVVQAVLNAVIALP